MFKSFLALPRAGMNPVSETEAGCAVVLSRFMILVAFYGLVFVVCRQFL